MSNVAVCPFFNEDVSELQFEALKLATVIFSKYENHRQLILEDVLSSLACLPSNKRNLRTYRLNAHESIQMLTALFLQLIQSAVKAETDHVERKEAELALLSSFDSVLRTAHRFLTVFLSKCTAPKSKGEEDYRPMFENFVSDLMATLYKPEWPATELVVSLLGNLLVRQVNSGGTSKTVEMSARVAALDYLGLITMSLRKDSTRNPLTQSSVDSVIEVLSQDDRIALQPGSTVSCMQKALLEYLGENSKHNTSIAIARQFYIAEWLRDCLMDISRNDISSIGSSVAKTSNKKKRHRKSSVRDGNLEIDESEHSENVEIKAETQQTMSYLWSQASSDVVYVNRSRLNGENLGLVTRYLSAKRSSTLSFDICLIQLLEMLRESAIQIRTKALKCLASVIEVDPLILARPDVQQAVHGRFMDLSVSVREAAVDLVGRFLVVQRDLTEQYYAMLSDRILDTGISVRKRVIKIFREICVTQPDFTKIPEMCSKMIRRIVDEEGIKKTVNDTFHTLWFTPVDLKSENANETLLRRVRQIMEVSTSCQELNSDWLEQLVENLLKEDSESNKDGFVSIACKQLVDCIVCNMLCSDKSINDDSKLFGCFSAMYLLCKFQPSSLESHCYVIQPYLSMKCSSHEDFLALNMVINILELGVPLMNHPSSDFVSKLEEDLMKLILQHGTVIILGCVRCLAAVTSNTQLIKDYFEKLFRLLLTAKSDPSVAVVGLSNIKRALFTVGVISKHFDIVFDGIDFDEVRESVLGVLHHFAKSSDLTIRSNAVQGLGWFLARHCEMMLRNEVQDLYLQLLSDQSDSPFAARLRCLVLKNLHTYLLEEERRMTKAEAEWKKMHNTEDLKEMRDSQSGMASTLIQIYLRQVLEAYFHVDVLVRQSACDVIVLVLRQGLVHPLQCVPYVIAMASDCDPGVRYKADLQLKEIDKKNPTFIQMKAMFGLKMSYRLHKLLNNHHRVVRGLRLVDDSEISLNGSMYILARSNRAHRRTLLTSLLHMFDEPSASSESELIFVADNLAYFDYQQQDEPLFVMHQIDVIVSVSGSHVLDSFHQVFHGEHGGKKVKKEDDDDGYLEDFDSLFALYPSDPSKLKELHLLSQRFILLLILKQHLKDFYGFTDSKVLKYSPTESAKLLNKQICRRPNVKFNPEQVFDVSSLSVHLNAEQEKIQLISNYIDFQKRMASIDRDCDVDDKEEIDETAIGATVVNEITPENNSVVCYLPETSSAKKGRTKKMASATSTVKRKVNKVKRKRRSRIIENDSSSSDYDD